MATGIYHKKNGISRALYDTWKVSPPCNYEDAQGHVHCYEDCPYHLECYGKDTEEE